MIGGDDECTPQQREPVEVSALLFAVYPQFNKVNWLIKFAWLEKCFPSKLFAQFFTAICLHTLSVDFKVIHFLVTDGWSEIIYVYAYNIVPTPIRIPLLSHLDVSG